jgi:hypothetical protein
LRLRHGGPRATEPDDARDDVDFDLDQVKVTGHFAHFLSLARDFLRDVDRLVALGDPPPLVNILALIQASRARCVSRANFFSTNSRRGSA